MKRIFLTIGTRPEAISMAPLVFALQKRKIEPVVCVTGENGNETDRALLDFGVTARIRVESEPEPQPLTSRFAKLTQIMGEILRSERPEAVVVHGDSISAAATALAAFYEAIPVVHVNAGVRSHRIRVPFPGEAHRRLISLIAQCHFAPTPTARHNLIAEGIGEQSVHLAGDPMIDALQDALAKPIGAEWDLPPRLTPILFRVHAGETNSATVKGMFRAARRIAEAHPEVCILCVLPTDPEIREAAKEAEGNDRIRFYEMPTPIRFFQLLSRCRIVMTDNGDLQEAVTSLGIPTVLMRYSAERAEGVRAGCIMLSGTHEDGITAAVNALLRPDSELYAGMNRPSDAFGDGMASERIAAFLSGVERIAENPFAISNSVC